MSSLPDKTKLIPRVSIGPGAKALMLVFFLVVGAYGVITIQYASALEKGSVPWSTVLTYLTTPGYESTETGMISGLDNFKLYKESFPVAMSSHFVLGGLVMVLGIFQFIPGLRVRYRQLHRALGFLLFAGMLTVSVSSIVFLTGTAPHDNIGGVMFWYLLLGLTGFSLLFLWQAALAVYKKQFRSHMLWMGLAYSCYLTAPFLRINYPITAFFDPQSINRVVPSSATAVLLQTIMIFAVWLIYVGERDLPSRKKLEVSALSRRIVDGVFVLSLLSMLGLVFLVGLVDRSAHMEGSELAQLLALGLFAVLRAAQMSAARGVWCKAAEGERPSVGYVALSVAAAASTFYLGSFLNTDLFMVHLLFYILISPVVMELLFIALSLFTKPLGNGANLFAHISAASTWNWAAAPATLAGLWMLGESLDAALAIALVLSAPMGMVGAVLFAAQVDINGLFLRSKQAPQARTLG